MMRSMFSGVSGLKVHQSRMDVIGNNVANVNTVGFKSGRVTFAEVFSQTLAGASAPDASTSRGGTNPKQIGLGTGISSIDTIMTSGSSERTDNPTDLSISGDGFFIVKGSSADTFKFTRAGNFGVDKLGNLVTGGGYAVYGWDDYTTATDGTVKFDTEKEVKPINLYTGESKNKKIIAAKATENAVFAGNLNAGETATTDAAVTHFSVPFTVYDSLGNAYELSVNFRKDSITSGTPSQTTWAYSITSGDNSTLTASNTTIKFDSNGKLITSDTGSPASAKLTIQPDSANTGADAFDIDLDFSKLTMFAADNSVKTSNVDGYSTGNLITFSIGSDGIITGVYSNGQQQPLGMLALASFANPAGMEKAGDNLFVPTTNSGAFTKGQAAGTEGVGTLNPGTLEMSNVDLSSEFTNMIITQRGFQANSRIITTSDEMLQELVNLKR